MKGLAVGSILGDSAPVDLCGPLPGSPSFDFDANQESYANSDPVSSAADQGSFGIDAVQATSTRQPTFLSPCEAGKLSEQPCYDADGGDDLVVAAGNWTLTQADLICLIYRYDAGLYAFGTDSASARHGMYSSGASMIMYAGVSSTPVAKTVGEYNTWCLRYDSTSSQFRKDGSGITVNAGTQGMNGIRLFDTYTGVHFSDGAIVRIVGYDTVPPGGAAAVEAVFNCQVGATPQALLDEPLTILVDVSQRVKRYVVSALKRGVAPADIVNRVVSRMETTREKATEMVQRSRGARGRDPDTLHTAHVGLLASRGAWGRANTSVAAAICKPLADEDDQGKGGCDSAELQTFTSRTPSWCRVSDGVEVIRAARGRFTPDEAARLDVEVRATAGLVSVAGNDKSFIAGVNDFAATLPGAPRVEPCPAPTLEFSERLYGAEVLQ